MGVSLCGYSKEEFVGSQSFHAPFDVQTAQLTKTRNNVTLSANYQEPDRTELQSRQPRKQNAQLTAFRQNNRSSLFALYPLLPRNEHTPYDHLGHPVQKEIHQFGKTVFQNNFQILSSTVTIDQGADYEGEGTHE